MKYGRRAGKCWSIGIAFKLELIMHDGWSGAHACAMLYIYVFKLNTIQSLYIYYYI